MANNRDEFPNNPFIPIQGASLPQTCPGLLALMKDGGLIASASEGRRLVEQGGVKPDGETVTDFKLELAPGGGERVLQVGRRKFLRLI